VRPKTRNKAFQAAYNKGRKARIDGKPKRSPYSDWDTDRGSVTWSRAFIRYWEKGWEDADQEIVRKQAGLG